ncbi:MAG TPA: SigB/SigF/SigG family RNA polymerase sigma factor [Thermoleophilaceae bacterium]|jgi:RNA polymerase sigma-B factor|nr:SigB/SigF/SigG family RNA polymerase sigma factor [Thermoleophilaceae bacterium]
MPDVLLRSRLSDNQLVKRHRAGDRASLDELTGRYRPLATGLARRYSYTSETADDLEQVACIGLVAAIKRYDPERGKSLRAFAVPTILGELRRHFRDTGWSVHMPRPLQERARDVREMTTKMTAELRRSPTPREVAERMDLTVEEVLESRAVRRAYSPDSLDAPPAPNDDGSPRTWESIHGCEEDGYARVEASAVIERAMRALPERERQIIRLRFGAELSQAEIGDALGISQMHVSRLLRRSLDRVEAIVSL